MDFVIDAALQMVAIISGCAAILSVFAIFFPEEW